MNRPWIRATLQMMALCGMVACKSPGAGKKSAAKDIDEDKFSSTEKQCSADAFAKIDTTKSVLVQVKAIPQSFTKKDGVGNFGTVIRNMLGASASDQDIKKFLKSWGDVYAQGGNVGSMEGPSGNQMARPGFKGFLDKWPEAGGKLTFGSEDPLRLVAIVNRLDLWNGKSDDAGETRLVFGHPGGSLAIIFEFRNPVSKGNLQVWAKRWMDLNSLTGVAYETKLAALVADVTGADVAGKESMIRGQIRMNEFFNSPWVLREYKFNGSTLAPALPKQTTTLLTNQGGSNADLGRFIVDNSVRIADGQMIDGFFPINPNTLHGMESPESFQKFTMPNEWNTSLADKGKELSDEEINCLVERSALPKAAREDIKAKASSSSNASLGKKEKNGLIFAQAVSHGFEISQCAGCHHTAPSKIGTFKNTGMFFHISPSGQVSDFVLNEAVPARKKFLSLATCTKTPKFVRTSCFKNNNKFNLDGGDVSADVSGNTDSDLTAASEVMHEGEERAPTH